MWSVVMTEPEKVAQRIRRAYIGSTESRTKHLFCTDHLMDDLKGRTVRGSMITIAAQAAKFGLRMVSVVVLARLLTPSDFGLVAMVTAVTGFVEIFKDAGLAIVTVQRRHITHEQISTLCWINIG